MAGCSYENLHCLPYVFLGKKLSKQEDLKEMGDISSGMSSSIMQLYLKQVLEAFFHNQSSVRHFALSVIALTLNQGLIHPVQVCSISPAAAAVGYSVIKNVGQMFRIFFFFCVWNKSLFLFRLQRPYDSLCVCAVCTLPHCNGHGPRGQHEEQSWPAAGGDW